jgi:flagellar biosynthetic protein FliR
MNFNIPAEHILTFMLVFCRVGTTVMFMPGIGEMTVSMKIRLAFGIMLCFIVTPVIIGKIDLRNFEPAYIIELAFHEVFVGLIIGSIFRVTINALHIAGTIVSFQSGFSSATLFDPSQGGQTSVFGSFYTMLFITLLMATDLHHYMINSTIDSYDIIHPNRSYQQAAPIINTLARMAADTFTIGVRFAAPFIIVGLIFFAVGGVLSKLMPQLQVFFILMPVQIMLSFAVLLLSLSISMFWFMEVYSESLHSIFG